MTGRTWRVYGRAAGKNRVDQQIAGQRTVEFDFCTSRDGEDTWIRAVTKGGCAILAHEEVGRGTEVLVEGKVEEKGKPDQTGKYKSRLVMFVERLVVGHRAASSQVDEKQSLPAGEAEKPDLEAYPHRWNKVGWDGTAGGKDALDHSPELAEARYRWLSGERPDETSEVAQALIPPDAIHEVLGRIGGPL